MQSVCYAWNCLDTHTRICHGLANVYVHTHGVMIEMGCLLMRVNYRRTHTLTRPICKNTHLDLAS